jgi:hypothetical protein
MTTDHESQIPTPRFQAIAAATEGVDQFIGPEDERNEVCPDNERLPDAKRAAVKIAVFEALSA